jgi:hypothetical protein
MCEFDQRLPVKNVCVSSVATYNAGVVQLYPVICA